MTNAELADKLESCEAVQVIYADRKETIQPAEFKTLLAALRLAAQADAPAIQPQQMREALRELLDATKHQPVDMFLRQRCEAALTRPECGDAT